MRGVKHSAGGLPNAALVEELLQQGKRCIDNVASCFDNPLHAFLVSSTDTADHTEMQLVRMLSVVDVPFNEHLDIYIPLTFSHTVHTTQNTYGKFKVS